MGRSERIRRLLPARFAREDPREQRMRTRVKEVKDEEEVRERETSSVKTVKETALVKEQ